MALKPVNDQALLAQLNGTTALPAAAATPRRAVTDPALLAQLSAATDIAQTPMQEEEPPPLLAGPDTGLPNVFGLTNRDTLAIGETGAQFLSGAAATPISGLVGLAGAALPGPVGQGAKWSGAIQNMFTYRPRTEKGRGLSQAVAYPFEKLAQFGDWSGQQVVNATGSEVGGTALNTAVQMLPALLLRGSKKPAAKPAATAEASGKHPAVAQAEAEGITLDPTQVVGGKPVGSLSKRILARGAGKADLPAEASIKNQKRVVEMTAEDIGLKKGEEITPAAIENLRKEANAKYDALQKVKAELDPDVDYFHALHEVRQGSRSAVKGGGPDPRINKLVNQYQVTRGKFSIGNVMEEVRRLRFDSKKNMAADSPETVRLGDAQRQIAGIMEDLIERQVSPKNAKAVQEWRGARQQLAKLHLVEDALKGTEIDASVFGKALNRGEPLTGNLKKLGEIANNFPHVMQTGARLGSKAGVGLLDVALSVPTMGAWALAREGAKRGALRKAAAPSRVSPKRAAVAATTPAASDRRSVNQLVPALSQ